MCAAAWNPTRSRLAALQPPHGGASLCPIAEGLPRHPGPSPHGRSCHGTTDPRCGSTRSPRAPPHLQSSGKEGPQEERRPCRAARDPHTARPSATAPTAPRGHSDPHSGGGGSAARSAARTGREEPKSPTRAVRALCGWALCGWARGPPAAAPTRSWLQGSHAAARPRGRALTGPSDALRSTTRGAEQGCGIPQTPTLPHSATGIRGGRGALPLDPCTSPYGRLFSCYIVRPRSPSI